MNFVVIGSGPSLTARDCDRVRLWHQSGIDNRVIVVNNSYECCLWADILYAADYDWVKEHQDRIRKRFQGMFYTADVQALKQWPWIARVARHPGSDLDPCRIPTGEPNGNSGFQALCLAVLLRASRIILLGFDHQHAPDGKTHYHGGHPAPFRSAVRPDLWVDLMERIAPQIQARGIRVINASRSSAIGCFDREDLETCLTF